VADSSESRQTTGVRSDTGPFAIVPEWLLDAGVSGNAVKLYAILARYADTVGKATPKRRTLATRMGVSVDTVDRVLRELEMSGAIKREARFESDEYSGASRQTTNEITVYRLRLPVRTDAEGGPSTDAEPALGTGAEPVNESQVEREPTEREDLAAVPAARGYDALKGMKLDVRNIPWDALRTVTNADEKVEAGQLAKALKQIRGFVVPTMSEQVLEEPSLSEQHIAQQIRARARLYRDRWPNVELTPLALAKNWSRVLTAQPGGDLDTALDAAQRGIDSARRSA
jgi:DNA-binding Lrp family transcriptional regulator